MIMSAITISSSADVAVGGHAALCYCGLYALDLMSEVIAESHGHTSCLRVSGAANETDK